MITRFIDLSLFGFLEEINASFRRFGSLAVDWPHKAESKSYFPPKGYAFLLFQVLLLYYQLLSYKFLNILLLKGGKFSAATYRNVHSRRGQTLPVRLFSDHQSKIF